MTNTNDIVAEVISTLNPYGKQKAAIELIQHQADLIEQQQEEMIESMKGHHEIEISMQQRIAELEAEVERLKGEFPSPRWDWGIRND